MGGAHRQAHRLSIVPDGSSDDSTRSYVQLAKDTLIGHYRIIEKIGAGGMGEVYLAEDTTLTRRVALKFLPNHLCQDPDCRARFGREARAAAALNHPNIVTIHEVGEFDGRPFIVAEHVGDRTFRDLIDSRSLDVSAAVNIVIQVCEGLVEAHAAGIVHRDIKPSNIVLEKHNHPKIVDFGLAQVRGTSKVTKSGTAMGTVAYMSPEQLKGKAVDHRTDLFSTGVMLYEAITGRHPFSADHDATLQHNIINLDPEPLARYKTGVPEGLQQVVTRALEKDSELRYQSAADLLADLRRLRRRGSDSDHSRTAPTPTERRHQITKLAILIGAVILLVAGMWALTRWQDWGTRNRAKQVAVLPMINLGAGGDGQSLCDGLMEVMTSKLTQLAGIEGGIQVVPSSEIRQRAVRSAAEARRTFGADWAVTGSLQEHDRGIRVSLNLVDAVSQRQVRSAVFDRQVTDMAAFQDLVVTELALMLDVPLGPNQRSTLRAGGTTSSDAYYAYVQGLGFLHQYDNAAALDSAETHLRLALAYDSSFALAYAGLAELFMLRYALSVDVRWVAPAIANATKALEISDALAPVLVTLAKVHRSTGQYEEAVRYLRQAMAIDSTDALTYVELAKTYEALGRETEAENCYITAIRLQPDSWLGYYNLAMFNLARGHRGEAAAQAARAEQLAPVATYPLAFVGGLYAYLGDAPKAKTLLTQVIELEPDYSAYSNLGALYQTEKAYDKAAEMYEKALAIQSTDYRVWINLASIYLLLPHGRDKALAAYDSAIVRAEANRRVNSNDPLLLAHLAECYSHAGQHAAAVSLALQAIHLAPTTGEILVRAAVVLELEGRRAEALDAIARALAQGFPEETIRELTELQNLVEDTAFANRLPRVSSPD